MPRPKSTPVSRQASERTDYVLLTGRSQNRDLTPRGTALGYTVQSQYQLSHRQVSPEMLMARWGMQGYQWVACSNGQMPSRAVQSGTSRSGEPMYIARGLTPEMTQSLATFIPSSRKCYIVSTRGITTVSQYEILCQRPKLQSRATPVSQTVEPLDAYLGRTLKIMTLRNPLKWANFGKTRF